MGRSLCLRVEQVGNKDKGQGRVYLKKVNGGMRNKDGFFPFVFLPFEAF